MRLAQELERRLGEARASWEAELQGRVAVAVEDAVQTTESAARAQLDQTNEARLAQELDRQLGEARASWEANLQGHVAAAVQDAVQRTQSESRIQLEQAQQEWRDVSAQEAAARQPQRSFTFEEAFGKSAAPDKPPAKDGE